MLLKPSTAPTTDFIAQSSTTVSQTSHFPSCCLTSYRILPPHMETDPLPDGRIRLPKLLFLVRHRWTRKWLTLFHFADACWLSAAANYIFVAAVRQHPAIDVVRAVDGLFRSGTSSRCAVRAAVEREAHFVLVPHLLVRDVDHHSKEENPSKNNDEARLSGFLRHGLRLRRGHGVSTAPLPFPTGALARAECIFASAARAPRAWQHPANRAE